MPLVQLWLFGKPVLGLGSPAGDRGHARDSLNPGPASLRCSHLWVGFPPPDLSGFDREGGDPAQSRAAHAGRGPQRHGRPFGREDEPVCQPAGCSGQPGCSTLLPPCQHQPGTGLFAPSLSVNRWASSEGSAWCSSVVFSEFSRQRRNE